MMSWYGGGWAWWQASNTMPGYGKPRLEGVEGGVYGYAPNKKDYLRRLRRIEGQVRGLQRMVRRTSTASTS